MWIFILESLITLKRKNRPESTRTSQFKNKTAEKESGPYERNKSKLSS